MTTTMGHDAGWVSDLRDARTLLTILSRALRPDQASYVTEVIEQCTLCLDHLAANRIAEASRVFDDIRLDMLHFDPDSARMCEIIDQMYLSAWTRRV